jgi:hypothetical protein
MPPVQITTFSFNIGKCLPHTRPESRYLVRLSMALSDLRIVADLLSGQIEHHQRMYFIRLMASHMHEALSLIESPQSKQAQKRTALPPLEDFLARYGNKHLNLQATVRDAQREVTLRLSQPLVCRIAPVGFRTELTRIRNQFFHYGWEKRDDRRLAAAMHAASELQGEYLTGEKYMRARFADEVSGQMLHPFLAHGIFVEEAAAELHRAILHLIGPVARFGQAAEALHFHSREHGVVTVEHPDGTTQVL